MELHEFIKWLLGILITMLLGIVGWNTKRAHERIDLAHEELKDKASVEDIRLLRTELADIAERLDSKHDQILRILLDMKKVSR